MNILLLGGSGLVGNNIAEHPRYSDYNFFCPSRKVLNLFDHEGTQAYIQKNNIDTVINAAGKVGGIQKNINHSFDFIHENLMIGISLACAVRELKIPRVINLASSCIYPKNMANPIKEQDLLTGKLEETNEGYALAKIATLKYFEYLSRETNHSYKTLIPCNLFGRYDHFGPEDSHLIASIITKMETTPPDSPVEIWGDGTARWEFMDAFDLADAIFFVLENYDNVPNVLNVGTGVDYTIKEYYEITAKVLGYKRRFVFNRKRPSGMIKKLLDVSPIESLGWKHNISLEEGIRRACHYYRETQS